MQLLTPPEVFRELHKALEEKKNSRRKTPISQALGRLDTYISSEGTLKGTHTSTRLVQIRLTNANAEAVDQYTSISHLLQWVPPVTIKNYSESKIMLSLRYLKADNCIKKQEPPVPRADSRTKERSTKRRRTSKEMMFYWNGCKQGQLSLMHEMAIPKDGVHTARAVPQVIDYLRNKEDPSLCTLAQWANQYYESSNLNLRQIIDGDLLQVLNAIHISGLLQQMGDDCDVVTVPESDNDQDVDKTEDEESTPTSSSSDNDEESDNGEENNNEEDSVMSK